MFGILFINHQLQQLLHHLTVFDRILKLNTNHVKTTMVLIQQPTDHFMMNFSQSVLLVLFKEIVDENGHEIKQQRRTKRKNEFILSVGGVGGGGGGVIDVIHLEHNERMRSHLP